VSEFLLAAARDPVRRELGLAEAASDMITVAGWHAWLRRWRLLRSYAFPQEGAGEPRSCLVVSASSMDAAARLAEGWARLSGYRVTVLQLFDVAQPNEPPL
jgi:hypothetical protein